MQKTIRFLLKKGILTSPELKTESFEEIKKRIFFLKNKPFVYDGKESDETPNAFIKSA